MTWIQGWRALPNPHLSGRQSHERLLWSTYQLMCLWLCVTNNVFQHPVPSGSREICLHSLSMKGVDCLSNLPVFYRVGEAIKDTFSHKIALSAVRLSSFLFLFLPLSAIEMGDKLVCCLDCSSWIQEPRNVLILFWKWIWQRKGREMPDSYTLLAPPSQ